MLAVFFFRKVEENFARNNELQQKLSLSRIYQSLIVILIFLIDLK